MTKNNLAQHLRWLLSRGPPQFPSFDLPATETSESTNLQANNNTNSVPLDAQAFTQQHDSLKREDSASVKIDRDGDVVIEDADMARLQLPPSSTKPRMLSVLKNSSPSTPGTPGVNRFNEDNGKAAEVAQRDSLKGVIPFQRA